jgi:hypothetical protein
MAHVRQRPQDKKHKRHTDLPDPHRKTSAPRSRLVDGALAWIPKHSLLLFLLLVTVGTLRIVSTYTVFSHTSDEPGHIAAGLEWLSKGI